MLEHLRTTTSYGVNSPIIGPRKISHREDSVSALDVSLTDDEIETLEAPIDPTWCSKNL